MIMIISIPASILIMAAIAGLLFLASINWAVIFAVLGVSALLLGSFLAWGYRNNTAMAITMGILFMLPGLVMWGYGVSLF